MLLSVLVRPALACAGLLVTTTSTGTLASSDAQQAILSRGDGTVTAEYRVRYVGDASDFGWIIPVPGSGVTVVEGSEARFVALETATAPTVSTFTVDSSEGGGCGCVDGKAGGVDRALGDGEPTGVSVIGSGYAGAFEYQILEAEEAGGFQEWLTTEGFDTTISADVITQYVAEGASWVVARIRPETPTTPDGGVILTPLRVGWTGTELRYPSRMAQTSMLPEVRIELYVLADSYAAIGGGWEQGYGYEESFDVEGVVGDDPAELYADHLRTLGGTVPRMYAAWSGTYTDAVVGTGFLVRWDTLVAPAANATDVTFTENGETWTDTTQIGLYDAQGETDDAFALPLGLLGLAWSRRRRRTGS